jgi:AraC-like DNA-binding protein
MMQERFSIREHRNTSRLFAALRSHFLRALLEQVAQRIDAELRFGTFWPDLRAQGARSLIVHDFQPDPVASVSWLDQAAGKPGAPTVFALLEAPVAPVLDSLARARHRFRISGVAVAAEDGAGVVAERLERALAFGARTALSDLVHREWRLEGPLAELAGLELLDARPHTTLGGLLHDADMSRKRFVPLARRAGFDPPVRFFQSLRVLRAVTLLGESMTLAEVRDALGYGSPATLRRHFRQLVGVSPDHCRVFSAEELVRRLAPGARAMPELVDPIVAGGRPRRTRRARLAT